MWLPYSHGGGDGCGREAALKQGVVLMRAQAAGKSLSRAAAELGSHAKHFNLDIDTGSASTIEGQQIQRDASGDPQVAGYLKRLRGQELEEMGRLWLRGKGVPQPEEQKF